jgi:hypothetical protein
MLAFAAPAQAGSSISCDYVQLSARGGGTLAPDNDVRNAWNAIQKRGINIVSSYPVAGSCSVWNTTDGNSHETSYVHRFIDNTFRAYDNQMSGWRFDTGNNGDHAYHDDYMHIYPFDL